MFAKSTLLSSFVIDGRLQGVSGRRVPLVFANTRSRVSAEKENSDACPRGREIL